MAYFYWRRYYRPRRRYYRRRYRNQRFFRRTRNRPRRRVSWRSLYRRKGRRKRRRHTQVRQWQPRYRTKCTIKGYLPLFFANSALAAVADFVAPEGKSFRPWVGGGVESCLITLLDLYWEERFWRARWSKSNQGYNLLRYFGCKLKLYPARHYSYIFWWSTEDLTEDENPLTMCHPSQLILGKNFVIVNMWSPNRKNKPKVLNIKPPATMLNTWMPFSSAAKLPLLKWRASFIDFDNAWTGFPQLVGSSDHTSGVEVTIWGQETSTSEAKNYKVLYVPWLDDGNGLKIAYKTIKWNGAGDGPDTSQQDFWPTQFEYETLLIPFYIYAFGWPYQYYLDFQGYHKPESQNPNTNGIFLFLNIKDAKRQWKTLDPQHAEAPSVGYIKYSEVRKIAASGIFTEKAFGTTGPANITMGYKFYFQWGGTPGQRMPPSQPADGQPQPWPSATLRWPGVLRADIRDPTTVDAEVLTAEDYDSDGIITHRALRRLTKTNLSTERSKAYQKGGIWGASTTQNKKRKRGDGTRTTEDDSSKESETETEHSGTTDSEEETPPRPRHRRKRKRLDRLVKLVQRLLIQQHS
uniref:Capsid protein n=1 Tax=Anelloviridae sp. TaxID=2055263 RepID=A0A2H4R0K7_9VIRU|nr:ORF1 [Anelloviridae sp.]